MKKHRAACSFPKKKLLAPNDPKGAKIHKKIDVPLDGLAVFIL